LCSKEELSLARAVTGSGLLTDEQFTRVRREAGQTSLPMYQTIVSFVRQMDLGGRSYAPGDANTLHELLPYLSQFNNIMEKLKRSFSFRKKKDHVPECSKPHQWQEDERKVRDGTCSFQVRYLGCIEVFESRGIQVCEEAVKALKAQCKGKYQRAILYVSGDALRVVDEISKGLIVDQTIEKVSFCAPDRNHEKGFAYICRDGTTRRWMCHGFLALKESGERLSHAVGCAFAICLEKKQKREKETVTVTFNEKGTSFSRTGSFRQTTLTERLEDPQSAIIAEPVPLTPASNEYAVQRPHATQDMLMRQGSFRGFSKLNESSPFKRQLSLRLNDLPSTLERQAEVSSNGTNGGYTNANGGANMGKVSPIPEASPTKEQADDQIAAMAAQISMGITALTSGDPFAPQSASQSNAQKTQNGAQSNIPGVEPVRQTNPWASPPPSASKVSDAEFWLNTTATSVSGSPYQQQQPHQQQQGVNGLQFHPAARAPHLGQLRSHSVDTAEVHHHQRAPTLQELSNRNPAAFQSVSSTTTTTTTTATRTTTNNNPWASKPAPTTHGVDPFDAAWAAKSVSKNNNTNPFQKADTVTKTFEAQV